MDQSTMIVFALIAVLVLAAASVLLLGKNAVKNQKISEQVNDETQPASKASEVENQAKSVAVKTREKVSEEDIGVSRRKFLNRSIYAMLGLGFGLPFASSLLAFLIPTGKGGFGGLVNVTTSVSEIISTIENRKEPYYVPEARAYLVQFPKESAAAVEAAQGTDAYSQNSKIIDGMVENGLVALYQKCPHLGCRVPWCESSQWFECPCHGSKFNRVGEKMGGPTPRGMDRFPFDIVANRMVIDTNLAGVVSGPPDGVNTTRQSAEGPVCV